MAPILPLFLQDFCLPIRNDDIFPTKSSRSSHMMVESTRINLEIGLAANKKAPVLNVVIRHPNLGSEAMIEPSVP